MMTDSEIKQRGFDALADALGIVEAERFITLVLRTPSDYTEWRKDNLFPNQTVTEIADQIKSFKAAKRKSKDK